MARVERDVQRCDCDKITEMTVKNAKTEQAASEAARSVRESKRKAQRQID